MTLRFLLVLWVPVALGIADNATPTLLNAMVAVGIVVGAGAAARFVTLKTVKRCMPAGILIGVAVAVFALQTTMLNAYVLLALIGMLGASSSCRSMRCCRSGANIRSAPAMRSQCKTWVKTPPCC